MAKLYDQEYKVVKRDGSEVSLNDFRGKVLLIVNTATGCGFTPQYEALENLYKAYHEKGLEIFDFPCDQFGHQAPGSDDEIHEFCIAKYKTSFDQFKKIEVNGENEIPLFTFLKSEVKEDEIHGMGNKMKMGMVKGLSKTYKKKEDIKWNFTKFLVNKEGVVIARLSPTIDPMKLEDRIKEALGE
ncbi:MAG: glutathione peroxidase [Anaeroplasma sp.]|uniref:glutathione peroxidase n=1 Tax=Anaeroplasma sp. TaxID=1872523 RepID=UPI002A90D24E|nr:glutathione peroxidase [Anaeroplasma sp.]MDY5982983.1 glutathione peroxidase [Anaeroplasma sp.]